MIRFTENDRPALVLQSLDQPADIKVIIPTIENTVDDIYLMVAVFILKKVNPSKEIHSLKRESLYEILETEERSRLYAETKNILEQTRIKLVFNILDQSHLLTQLEKIKEYPEDFEITLPAIKKEHDAWENKVITKGMQNDIL